MCFYGTFALGGLFKSDDERKADASRTKDIFIKTAQELGYERLWQLITAR